MEVGDLSSKRDWSDVRDIVRGYWLALDHCRPGEAYNIASERPIAVGEMLDVLRGLSTVRVETRVDPNRLRPSDVPRTVCDAGRFYAATGWEARIPLEQSLRDVLDDWREKVAAAHKLPAG